jgi:hypothetical protein
LDQTINYTEYIKENLNVAEGSNKWIEFS